MSARHPDYTKHGFAGNPDIYGIGIRVGYYTQAASLWVANLFVPHYAPFLQTVTQLFLISILVGVIQLSLNHNTYAVEPYMLMQIAYNTSFMGVFGYPTPELLIWERNYLQRLIPNLVGLSLHSYDAWFWWIGRHILKPTDGPEGEPIFFPYVGRVELYGWVQYLAKAGLVIPLTMLPLQILTILAYAFQQWRLDREMPPSKFVAESSKWLEEAQAADPIDACLGSPESVWQAKDGNLTAQVKRPPSIASKSSQQTSWPQSSGLEDEIFRIPSPSPLYMAKPRFKFQKMFRKDADFTLTGLGMQRSPWSPFQPDRHSESSHTNTGRRRSSLFNHLWSSKSRSDRKAELFAGDYQLPSHSFHGNYNPTFSEILHADSFLSTICSLEKIPYYRWHVLCSYILAPFYLLPLLLFRGVRPQLLFATLSYANNLSQTCQLSYPTIVRHALAHPFYSTLDWRSVAFMGRLKLTLEHPVPPSRIRRLIQGWTLFSSCSVIIIGTELTIQWNYITGINNINSVGQLVPFTVGVGGLIRVCWSAVFDKSQKEIRRSNRCIMVEKVAPWMEAAESWKRVKERYETMVKKEDPLSSVEKHIWPL